MSKIKYNIEVKSKEQNKNIKCEIITKKLAEFINIDLKSERK